VKRAAGVLVAGLSRTLPFVIASVIARQRSTMPATARAGKGAPQSMTRPVSGRSRQAGAVGSVDGGSGHFRAQKCSGVTAGNESGG